MSKFFFWKRSEPASGERPPAEEESRGLLTGDARQDEESLQMLLESIAEVSTGLQLDAVLQGIVDRSLRITGGDRAMLLLGSDPESLEVRTARSRDGVDLGSQVEYSRSTVKRSIEGRRAGQYRVQSSDEALQLGQSVYDLKLRSVMCAPLEVQGRLIGVIYVDSKATRGEYSSRDLALFDALSSQLAIALDNARLHADSLEKARLEKDVEIARQIQMHLLPTVPEQIPDLDMAICFEAVSQASGDSYDFMPLDEHRFAVLVGDVTGHGVGAALLTHAAQAAVRSYLELVDDIGEVVSRLNNRLVASVEPGVFISMALFVVDTRQRCFSYVNAGHPPIFLVRGDELLEFEKTGMVLGVVEDQQYSVRGPIALERDDLLFVRTDGVEETMNSAREIYGVERLKEFLIEHRRHPAQEILVALKDALRAHAAGLDAEDDLTMIALKYQPQ